VLSGDRHSGAKFVAAAWTGGEPTLEVVSRFSTRDRAVDPAHPAAQRTLGQADRAAYLRPTRLVPLDGVVKATSDSIVRDAHSDIAKVQAIYEWVVDNTYRNAATAGCGVGDVVTFLSSRPMGGKCADINRLFVGLVRAAGIPAREIYGVRVAPSRFGYKSLGANTETITKAQHCRAEVHIAGLGWFPVDPADVRKVALEEPPGHLDMTADKVVAARKTLFGAWETNWLAYNSGQDVQLSGSQGGPLPFLMYPQAEVDGERLNCLDQTALRYTMTAREIVT
jgi:transglutaminase-like putative cysteine protease